MFANHRTRSKAVFIFLDLCTIAAAFFLSFPLRTFIRHVYRWDLFPDREVISRNVNLENYLVLLPILLLAHWITLHYSGIYAAFRRLRSGDIIWLVTSSVLLTVGILGSVVFSLKMSFVSRSLILMYAFLCMGMLIGQKLLLHSALLWAAKKGYGWKNLLIVGTGRRAVEFARRMDRQKEWGYRVLGFVDDFPANDAALPHPIIGKLRELPYLLRREVVDTVAFVVPRSWIDKIGDLVRECELQGKEVTVAIDLFDHHIGEVLLSDMAGVPVLQFETTFLNKWQVFVKRGIDLAVSLVMILLTLPLLIGIAIWIKIVSSDGPVFFVQKRCGLNGRVFPMLKFRTMVPNAEALLEKIRHLNEAISGPGFKMENDPRFIRGGKFLRKYSLDEMPQLLNVFWGHMSLVGPRPPIPKEVEEYDNWQRRRISVRPGLTCLWQVGGRTNIGFEEQMNLDLSYIDRWSLWLDLKILLRTIPAVVGGTGK